MLEIILFVAIIFIIILISFRRPKGFPPGPHGLIAFKNLVINPQKYFEWVNQNYGGLGGIVVPTYNIVIAGSKQVVAEVLSNPHCQGRPDNCLLRDRLEGENAGIFFTEGELWKESRRFLLHHLRIFGFGQAVHESLIGEQRDLLIDHIGQLNGKPFSIEDMLYLPNINIIWGIIGGQTFSFESKELDIIRQSLKDIIHSVTIIGGMTVIFPIMKYIAPEMIGYNQFINGYKNLRTFSAAVIKKHKETLNPNKPRDIIDVYLLDIANNSENVDNFTEIDIEGTCIDMLTAADTTVATLSFSVLHLCENQHYQEKIYEEIIKEVGPNQKIGYEDRNKLVYTEAFLMEMMRFKTPAPTTTPHRVMEDTIISGYQVPKHTIVFVNLRSIFMSKEHWKDPENFRPERFINEDMTIKKDEWLIPFSKGKRSCFGEVVAKTAMFMWLTSLIQNFTIKFPPGFKLDSNLGYPRFIVQPPIFPIICTPRVK